MASASMPAAADVKHLAERLNIAQIKVKRLARLEAALVDVFMEVMERTAALPTLHSTTQSDIEDDSAFARNERKEEHLKKAESDPIALLNALRTHLRVQFTSYEQQHHEMQGSIARLTTRGERIALESNEEVHKWEAGCEASKQQMRVLAQHLTIAQDDHDRTTKQYKRSLEQLNAELHTLRAVCEAQREQLSKRQADVEELKHANDALARNRKRVADELARSGDYLRSNSNGGGARSPVINGTASGGHVSGLFGSTPAEQQNLKRVLQDYECQLSKLEATNDELRNELVRQQQHLASVRQSTQSQHCFKLEKDAKKQRERLEETIKKLGDQEAELLRSRAALKERDALIQDMKDEYNKLFTSMQKIKQTPPTQARTLARSATTTSIGLNKPLTSGPSATSVSKRSVEGSNEVDQRATQANENPYLLQHYKAKIEQQQKELEHVQTQVRKMIASEYRHKQKNKLFRVERVQLKDTCDVLRSELERAVKTTAKAMAQQSPFYLVGEDTIVRKSNSLQPEDDELDSRGEDDEREMASDQQLCCTIADVRRLRQRNQYLEQRFRAVADQAPFPVTKDNGVASRPPRPSTTSTAGCNSSSSSSSLRRSSSTVEIPVGAMSTEKSIDASTMQALKQVKLSARTRRPQSAGPRTALLRSDSNVLTHALL